MKPTYQTLLGWLENASRQLPPADAPVFGSQVADWVERLPLKQVTAGDDAVRAFVAKRQWPELENDARAELHLRMAAAKELCQAMLATGEPVFPMPVARLHEMLLIDYWHGKGADWARLRYGKQN